MPEEFPERSEPPYYYRLELSRVGRKWITDNKRMHYLAKAVQVRHWREVAAWRTYRDLGKIQIDKARIVCELRLRTKQRRDPNNWAPTAKAVLDGMVDAGLFPDDDATHVIGPDMRLGPQQPNEVLIMHIWPLE